MADYVASTGTDITIYTTASGDFSTSDTFGQDVFFSDNDAGNSEFDTAEALTYDVGPGLASGASSFVGTTNIMGTVYPVLTLDNGLTYVIGIQLDPGTYPDVSSLGLSTANFTVCFAAGTMIATALGDCAVEQLKIGDQVRRADGGTTKVTWIGRQTIVQLFAGPRAQMVRIRAGALGEDLPSSDLTVTADHGMVLDGYVINAAALVNGQTIDFVPMAELEDRFTVYHIETAAHDVILANDAPTETFIDYIGRQTFDNYAEYEALYGDERIIDEMPLPRISAARLVPQAIQDRLGIAVVRAA